MTTPTATIAPFLVLTDDDKVKELAYDDASGYYIRSSGAWHKLPDDDDRTIWDLEWVDVSPAAVPAFDIAEKAKTQLTREDMREYFTSQ